MIEMDAILDLRPRAPGSTLHFMEIFQGKFALLPAGADKIHWSLGFGLAFENAQIDLGIDFSDFVDTVSLSAIYSF